MSPEGSPPSGISLGNPSHHADFCPQRALPPPVQGQTRAQAFQAIKGLSGPGLRHEPRGSLRRQRTASLILSSLWPCPRHRHVLLACSSHLGFCQRRE